MKKIVVVLLLPAVMLFCCTKSKYPPPPPASTDVYVVGDALTANNTYAATIWKNGIETKLSDSAISYFATAITVQGTDVYVAGYSYNGAYTAMYWKNGVQTILGPGQVQAIAVNGADVYLAGVDGSTTRAVYWKNGVETHLTGGTYRSFAQGIAVNGTDVYICGATDSTADYLLAVYWKNAVATLLGSNPHGSVATGIAIAGGHIYFPGYISELSGSQYTSAGYWGDGAFVQLPDIAGNTANSFGASIAVNANTVYVAGQMGAPDNVTNLATYWTHDIINPLASVVTLQSSSQLSTDARAIAVNGTDVYVAGYSFPNRNAQVATYWKNAVPVQLTNERGEANGIAVVTH